MPFLYVCTVKIMILDFCFVTAYQREKFSIIEPTVTTLATGFRLILMYVHPFHFNPTHTLKAFLFQTLFSSFLFDGNEYVQICSFSDYFPPRLIGWDVLMYSYTCQYLCVSAYISNLARFEGWQATQYCH